MKLLANVVPQYMRLITVYRKVTRNADKAQEAQLSLMDRATRACQLKSCKLLYKCRQLALEMPEADE